MLRLFHRAGSSFIVVAPIFAAACATLQNEPSAAPAARAAPSAPVYELSEILGASAKSVDALLGAPALTRREGEGEYRRYGLRACTLIVILYPDETGAAKAAHVDAAALNSDEEKPDLAGCLAAG